MPPRFSTIFLNTGNDRFKRKLEEALTYDPPDWHQRAKCLGVALIDPKASDEFFFPHKNTTGRAMDQRRAYCSGCPVMQQCQEAGESEVHGVWGGDYSDIHKAEMQRRHAATKKEEAWLRQK